MHVNRPRLRTTLQVTGAAGIALLLAACGPAQAPESASAPVAAPATADQAAVDAGPPAPPAEEAGWRVSSDGPWRLEWRQGDAELAVTCEEGKKELRFSFEPAWELDGPFENARVTIGDMTVEAKADPASLAADKWRPVYVVPANADTVTALMTGTTLKIALADGSQERAAEPDAAGNFDMFATTCAQINGLK
jgi:hypothetical protein